MTQEVETAVVELDLVSCQTCDLMFVASERRQTCPVCGGEGTGPYLEFVLDESGLRLKNGSAVLPAGGPAEDVPGRGRTGPVTAAEMAEGPEPPMAAEPPAFPVLGIYIAEYLSGADVSEEDLRGHLEEAGAKPRAVRVTVQRLTAVRDTLRELAAAGAEPEAELEAVERSEEPAEAVQRPEEPAEAEAETPPAEAPEDALGVEAGEKS